MGIAVLLLGLVPLIFLPGLVADDEVEIEDFATDSSESGDSGDLLIDEADGVPVGEPVISDILAPVDMDDAPDDGGQPIDLETVLTPVDEDDSATPSDGSEGEVLQPIDQIESDLETIWVDGSSDAGLGYVEINDFEVGQDILHITISPEQVNGELDVDVGVSENGQDAKVFVEQQLIAVLTGASYATKADVEVVVARLAA